MSQYPISRTDRTAIHEHPPQADTTKAGIIKSGEKLTTFTHFVEHVALKRSAKQKNRCIMTNIRSQPVGENSQFGLANIPFGVVSTKADPIPKIATRVFDQVFLIPNLVANGHLDHLNPSTRSSLLQVWSPMTT